jgi:hypothetical protein
MATSNDQFNPRYERDKKYDDGLSEEKIELKSRIITVLKAII